MSGFARWRLTFKIYGQRRFLSIDPKRCESLGERRNCRRCRLEKTVHWRSKSGHATFSCQGGAMKRIRYTTSPRILLMIYAVRDAKFTQRPFGTRQKMSDRCRRNARPCSGASTAPSDLCLKRQNAGRWSTTKRAPQSLNATIPDVLCVCFNRRRLLILGPMLWAYFAAPRTGSQPLPGLAQKAAAGNDRSLANCRP
jgi:hypothetical protein